MVKRFVMVLVALALLAGGYTIGYCQESNDSMSSAPDTSQNLSSEISQESASGSGEMGKMEESMNTGCDPS